MQWQAPDIQIRKEVKYLGVVNANPSDYCMRYGASLFNSSELPDFVTQIKPPTGIVLAADQHRRLFHELEGEIDALKLVDLDKEGLGEYKEWLKSRGVALPGSHNSLNSYMQQYQQQSSTYTTLPSPPPQDGAGSFWSPGINPVQSVSASTVALSTAPQSNVVVLSDNNNTSGQDNLQSSSIISQIFSEYDSESGKITLDEAERVFSRLNNRMERGYGDDETKAFLASLTISDEGQIDLNELKQAFEKIFN